MEALIVTVLVVAVVVLLLTRALKIVPQAHAGIVERLGRYNRTLAPGLAVLIPMIDRVKPLIDMRGDNSGEMAAASTRLSCSIVPCTRSSSWLSVAWPLSIRYSR